MENRKEKYDKFKSTLITMSSAATQILLTTKFHLSKGISFMTTSLPAFYHRATRVEGGGGEGQTLRPPTSFLHLPLNIPDQVSGYDSTDILLFSGDFSFPSYRFAASCLVRGVGFERGLIPGTSVGLKMKEI